MQVLQLRKRILKHKIRETDDESHSRDQQEELDAIEADLVTARINRTLADEVKPLRWLARPDGRLMDIPRTTVLRLCCQCAS